MKINTKEKNQEAMIELIEHFRAQGIEVELTAIFSDEEILEMFSHPYFCEFSDAYKKLIETAVFEIFERELKGREAIH